VSIGDYVEIGEGVVILNFSVGSNAKLGNFTSIMGSMIGQESIIGDFSTTTGYVNIANATLGKKVFVGSHSVVIHGVNVGDNAFICVGSIVIRNVKANTKVFGNPAKKIDVW
jgi:acetyltransferase-like isoleucine patch superfamily enzyme